MKRLLLALSLGILLSACAAGGGASKESAGAGVFYPSARDQSKEGSCPPGQRWSTNAQQCVPNMQGG